MGPTQRASWKNRCLIWDFPISPLWLGTCPLHGGPEAVAVPRADGPDAGSQRQPSVTQCTAVGTTPRGWRPAAAGLELGRPSAGDCARDRSWLVKMISESLCFPVCVWTHPSGAFF